MKKKLIFAIFILLVSVFPSAENMYTYRDNEIDVKVLFSQEITYDSEESVIVSIIIKNISNRKLNVPNLDARDPRFILNTNPENSTATCIFDYYEKLREEGFSFSTMGGGSDIELEPGKEYVNSYNVIPWYNIEEIFGPNILYIYGEISLEEEIETIPGIVKCKKVGTKPTNEIRLFLNMESELVSSSLIVEPHKWNTAWEKEQSDAGVFTVFLGNIDGYSVKDIKQDTVLFNGTLNPVDIKITGSHKDMKGKVMMLKFKKKDGMEYLGIKEPGDIKKINISGQLNDDKWFHAEAEVEIEGAKEKGNK
ncbi:hypothetical protein KAU32_06795 [bacterium]|nr:hypothetical protein [bacterium]